MSGSFNFLEIQRYVIWNVKFCLKRSGYNWLFNSVYPGQTPARKTYAYPKNFRHLPSDDQILKSFHEKMKIEQEAEEERQLLEQEAVANMKDNDEKDLSSVRN